MTAVNVSSVHSCVQQGHVHRLLGRATGHTGVRPSGRPARLRDRLASWSAIAVSCRAAGESGSDKTSGVPLSPASRIHMSIGTLQRRGTRPPPTPILLYSPHNTHPDPPTPHPPTN